MWPWSPLRQMSEAEFRQEQERLLQLAPVPVFWLFGKTGSGKTSVVKYLSGAEAAEIGNGFKPQTRCSAQYDFPCSENPICRFLDTRGLGETAYDPAEDIQQFRELANLVIVTVRVADHSIDEILTPLKSIRAADRERPIVLALTCLHEIGDNWEPAEGDPFAEIDVLQCRDWPADIPPELVKCLEKQRERFGGLVDCIVPLDFTKPEECFADPNFGGERLKGALIELLPSAYRQTLINMQDTLQPLKSLQEKRAMPYVLGYSTMAATAAAVPTPWLDVPVVMAIQSHLMYQLAHLYGQKVDGDVVAKAATVVGGRLLTRMMVRESLKFIPLVGMAANAALAFAYTYASGKVWSWYFSEVCHGSAPSKQEIERIWQQQLEHAASLWKNSRTEEDHAAEDRP